MSRTLANIHPDKSAIPGETSPKVILKDREGNPVLTAMPGSASDEAIIGDKTYTAGGPLVTSAGNEIQSILSNGVIYNGKVATYTTNGTAEDTSELMLSWTDKGNGTMVVRGQTLTPDGPDITTNGHTFSAATFGYVLDGTTVTTSSTSYQTVTFESETLTASEVSSGVFAINTATLTAGESAKTVLGQEVTAASTGLLVDDATSSPSASTTSSDSDSGVSKLGVACSCGLVVLGLGFFML